MYFLCLELPNVLLKNVYLCRHPGGRSSSTSGKGRGTFRPRGLEVTLLVTPVLEEGERCSPHTPQSEHLRPQHRVTQTRVEVENPMETLGVKGVVVLLLLICKYK